MLRSVAECRGVPPLARTVSPGNVKESWHPALTSSLSSAICPSLSSTPTGQPAIIMSEFETLDGQVNAFFATGSLPSECAGGGSYSYGYGFGSGSGFGTGLQDYSYSYQIDDFFNIFDANGDSLVTLPELLAEPGPPPFLTCLFNLIVTDNPDTNGRWSVVEVAECCGVSRSVAECHH